MNTGTLRKRFLLISLQKLIFPLLIAAASFPDIRESSVIGADGGSIPADYPG